MREKDMKTPDAQGAFVSEKAVPPEQSQATVF